ncbi:MAG: phosphate ABC transporter permease PstA [Caulobacteraceae bacterium]|nr:phosphate ABC transporter permease PstA [Caulobacter sp.]
MAAAFDRRARRGYANGAFIGFCWFSTALAIAALLAILASLVVEGIGGLNAHVFTLDTPAAGNVGGLRNAIVGSILMCVLAMVGAVVVGVLAGTWLAEYGDRNRWTQAYASTVRFINDVLLSAPSILVGLFIYEILVAPFHGFSGWAGAVALALIAVPVVVRTTEDVLKLQARQLRESGVALGTPVWTTIRAILWRAAGGGIITGALLAFARISGETAPLLFTALNNQFFSWNMAKPMANLPTVIFNYALSAYDDWRRLAWVGALLIAGAVLAINIVVRALSREPQRR